MNANVSLVDPSRHCVHNNVALCALTFKIVVLAWNRSNQQQAKEIESFVVSDFFLRDKKKRFFAQAKLFAPLIPFPG